MINHLEKNDIENLLFEFYKIHQKDYHLDKLLYEFFQEVDLPVKFLLNLDKIFGIPILEISHRRERYAILIE